MSMPTFDKDLNLRRLMAAQSSLQAVANSEPNNTLAHMALIALNQALVSKLCPKPEA